ncbi:MAG: hypothetical protein Q8M83_01925 [bacterium]|nr:hypothetical protein [bacterium]
MEKEPISKKEQTRDALLISLSGGVIGIIGAIAEVNILFSPNLDIRSAILMGGATLTGAVLAFKGTISYIDVRRTLRKKAEE